MHNLEAEIKDAIALPQVQIEPETTEQPQQQEVTIYDFGKLMEWSDTPNTQPTT